MPDLMETVLIERTRELIPDENVQQRRMFGTNCFLVNGNMLICASPRGLLARVGKDLEEEALKRPHASRCVMGGRTMTGFIRVDPEGFETDEDLKTWVDLARSYVSSLPAKKPGEKKPRGRKPKRQRETP